MTNLLGVAGDTISGRSPDQPRLTPWERGHPRRRGKAATTLPQALSAHLDTLRDAGLKPETVRKARNNVEQFSRHHALPDDTPVASLTAGQVEAFLTDGRERRHWAGKTERKLFNRLSQFFSTCVAQGFIGSSPMEGMEAPSYTDRRPEYPIYTDEDMDAIFRACDANGWRWMKWRNLAIIWLMWSGGLKRREILAVQVLDVDFEGHTIKTPRRTVRLAPEAISTLKRYLRARQSDSPHLFLRRGKKPISVEAYGHLMTDITKITGKPAIAQGLHATFKASGRSHTRSRRNPHTLLNRKWPRGPMAQARAAFLDSVEAQGLSRGTLLSYQASTARFLAHILERRPGVSPQEITPADIEGFLTSLHVRRYAAASVHLAYRGVRRWFGFLHDREEIPSNPVVRVKPPRVPKFTIAPYSHQDVEALLAAATEDPNLAERDIAIITVLYGTGVRRQELLNLTPSDIKPGKLLIRQGKGRKDRWVPLDSHTEGVLRRYADSRSGAARLFTLTATGLYHRLRVLGQRAGVKDMSRPVHRFRDTYAVRYLEKGGAIDDLQVILGHADMETTLRYVRWGREQRAVDGGRQYSPWANNGNDRNPDDEPGAGDSLCVHKKEDELALLEELERITRRKLELLQVTQTFVSGSAREGVT